jgi:hypothetical protein
MLVVDVWLAGITIIIQFLWGFNKRNIERQNKGDYWSWMKKWLNIQVIVLAKINMKQKYKWYVKTEISSK